MVGKENLGGTTTKRQAICHGDGVSGCRVEKDFFIDDHISKIDSFEEKNHFLDEYRNTLSDVLYKVKEINSQKSKSEMDSLVLNYQRVLTSTPKDSAIFNANFTKTFNSIYSQNELNELDILFKKLIALRKDLSNDKRFDSFDSYEKELFQESLSMKVLESNGRIYLFDKTRLEKNNSECLNLCLEAYHWELMAVAVTVICAAGAAAETCMTLGTLSIPALIQFIAAYAIAAVQLDLVTANYHICVRDCNLK